MALAAVGVAQHMAAPRFDRSDGNRFAFRSFIPVPAISAFPTWFADILARPLIPGALFSRPLVLGALVLGALFHGALIPGPVVTRGVLAAVIPRPIIPVARTIVALPPAITTAAAIRAGPVVARTIIPRAFVARTVIPGAIIPRPILPGPILPRAFVAIPRLPLSTIAVEAVIAGLDLTGARVHLHGLLTALILEINVIARGELVSAQDLADRTVWLDGAKQAEVMLCVLEVVLPQDAIASGVRVARQLLVFFENVLRIAAHLDAFRAVGVEGAIGVLLWLTAAAGAATAATPVAPALALHTLEISHNSETVRLFPERLDGRLAFNRFGRRPVRSCEDVRCSSCPPGEFSARASLEKSVAPVGSGGRPG